MIRSTTYKTNKLMATMENKEVLPYDAVLENIAAVINEMGRRVERAGGWQRLKSSPIKSLIRRGQLNAEYIAQEYKRVLDKTSQHSSSERQLIEGIVSNAMLRTIRQFELLDLKKPLASREQDQTSLDVAEAQQRSHEVKPQKNNDNERSGTE